MVLSIWTRGLYSNESDLHVAWYVNKQRHAMHARSIFCLDGWVERGF